MGVAETEMLGGVLRVESDMVEGGEEEKVNIGKANIKYIEI